MTTEVLVVGSAAAPTTETRTRGVQRSGRTPS